MKEGKKNSSIFSAVSAQLNEMTTSTPRALQQGSVTSTEVKDLHFKNTSILLNLRLAVILPVMSPGCCERSMLFPFCSACDC